MLYLTQYLLYVLQFNMDKEIFYKNDNESKIFPVDDITYFPGCSWDISIFSCARHLHVDST